MSGLFTITPVAKSTPFDPTGSSLVSEDVNAAIIEVLSLAGASRYPATFGKQGTVSNAFLDRWNQIGSDITPFIVPEPGLVKALSTAVSVVVATTDVIITIYKNAISIDTITIPIGSMNAAQSSLSLSVTTLDEISAKVTQGSARNPILDIFIQVTA